MTQSPLSEEQLLEDVLERDVRAPDVRSRLAATVLGAAFVAATALILALDGVHDHGRPVAGVISVLALAAAMRVRFDVLGGFTVPTQLAFVPLLFALPPGLVPVAVVVAVALGRLPDVIRRDLHPGRLVHAPANSWFAVGPAAVLAVTGIPHDPVALLGVAGLAFAAQVAGDFASSCLRDALVSGTSVRQQFAEARYVYGVDLALTPPGLLAVCAAQYAEWSVGYLLPLLGLLGFFAQERRARLEALLELNSAYRGTALVLGDVVEADDGYTGQHSKGVVQLALEVGEELGLEAPGRRNLEFGALLHDVGKVAIPKEIINKPGKLSPEEWTIIKTHTIEGQRMLDRVGGFMRDVGRIVRSHHERWDGSGYPDGLAGEAIPLEARIVCCCDAFNAMTTTRSYRQALPVATAIAELRSHSGAQFDPRVVEALIRIVGASEPELHLAPAALAA